VTLIHSIGEVRVFRYAAIIALLVVAFGPNRRANAASQIAPFVTTSGAVDNGVAGNTFINCTAGTGLIPGELVLLAINTLSVGTTITPPAAGPGIPAWSLIDPQTLNGDYTQQYYWHEVGTAESGGPTFEFTLTNGQGAATVRAACVAAAYQNTCLESATPCTSPISAVASGTSIASSNVEVSASVSFPNNSLVVGAFGTTDTNSRFGDSAANQPFVSGVSGIDQSSGPVGSPNLSSINGVSGKNGGIMITNLTEPFAGIDGPWLAALPQLGNFPTIRITNISGNGTTVTGTVQNPTLLNQYMQPSFMATISSVTGGSPTGCFNGTFTVTPTPPAPSTTFTYPDAGCSGTGEASAATIAIQDPGTGDNVAQIVSIIPNAP
jgi:hypothetical protein